MGDLLHLRDVHEQTQMLLPWHVNGSLEPGEATLVETHLAECAECRADVAANLTLRQLYRDAVSEPAPDARARLDVGPAPAWRRAGRQLSLGWGKAAALAMAAAAGAVLVLVAPRQSDGEFRLLGSNESAPVGNAIVLFLPETTGRDLRVALEQAQARVVDGPTASGAYVVHVDPQDRAEALAGLRASPHVVLAEPIDAAGGP